MGKGAGHTAWQIRLQSAEGKQLMLIPGVTKDPTGALSGRLLVLSQGACRSLDYGGQAVQQSGKMTHLRLGQSVLTDRGLWLHGATPELNLQGTVHFGPFLPVRYPLHRLPGMDCHQKVLSLYHQARGRVELNGDVFTFRDTPAYMDLYAGKKLPRQYFWAQSLWRGSSFTLAVARCGRLSLCTAALYYKQRLLRLSSLSGARVERWDAEGAAIRWGRYLLLTDVLSRPDAAGECALRVRLWRDEELLLDHRDMLATVWYRDEKKTDDS